MQGSYLGPHYDDAFIQDALLSRGFPAARLSYKELEERIVEQLEAGCVIGYFQGRAEFGPRALGNRTILGDPRNPEMQKRMNLKIKFRESFRPFAPIVLEERAKDYFEIDCQSPYMLLTAPVSKKRRLDQSNDNASILDQLNQLRSDIPAVTHVDYSARVQTVSRSSHPKLHSLLKAFENRTGCPVLVNTSFNVRGEPPVCHPDEAIECFLDTEMDCLALGPFLLKKSDLEPHQLRETAHREFAPD
ncbi:MAG: carbamoyltransferase C-terminal domain-containing protein, partial [Verrucomicrobiota bacterium]